MHLGLAEMVVLAVVDERPIHGFAVAALTARDGELGRVWHLPRPVVYRAINRLLEADLIRAEAVESDAGPQRTIYTAKTEGRRRTRDWLQTPVEHVREMRSAFLLKLALLHRRGEDRASLLARQNEVLTEIAAALRREGVQAAGPADFEPALVAWRQATTSAALAFVADLSRADAVVLSTSPDRTIGPS
jgi:DNA-binding PadR family transcriptional regulator